MSCCRAAFGVRSISSKIYDKVGATKMSHLVKLHGDRTDFHKEEFSGGSCDF